VWEQTPATHAWPSGQSLAVLQPHVPLGRHVLPVHAVQLPPVVPHAAEDVPGWQLAPSQHPPRQGELDPPQATPQVPAVHACPAGQLVHIPPLDPQASTVAPA